MDRPDSSHPTGRRLRRRVRILTAGIAGTAIMATVGVTAVLAGGPDGTTSTANPSTSVLSADDAATSSTGTGARSGSLDAPARAPSAASGSGHASSGGS